MQPRPTPHITSPANPRIKATLKLRKQGGSRGRRAIGQFLAEGEREVDRAIAAGLTVVELFATATWLQQPPFELPQAPVHTLPEALFKTLCYHRQPEGVLAVVETPAWSADAWLETARDGTQPDDDPLLLVAVGTAKPGNLGAMARTAEAAGCAGLLAAGAEVDAFNPNAIRSSTGAVFTLPIVSMTERDAIDWLSASPYRVLASTPGAGVAGSVVDYRQVDWSGPVAVVIGPEDRGLGGAWLDSQQGGHDRAVTIPTRGRGVDSLNASTAAAVLLFEALRHRRA